MKKNYFILSLLALVTTAAWAQDGGTGVGKGNKLTDLEQLTNPKEAFTLNSVRGTLNVVENATYGDQLYSTKTLNAGDPSQLFFIEKSGESYYLKAYVNGKYAVLDENLGDNPREHVFFTAEAAADATPINLVRNEAGHWQVYFTGGETKGRLNMQDPGYVINDWEDSEDDGNRITITSVGEPIEVTYDIYVGTEKKKSVKRIVNIGDAPSLDTGDYAIYTYDVEKIEENTKTVQATLVKYSVVSDLAELTKNAKEGFTINSGRGYLYAKEDATYDFILSSLPTADVTEDTPNQKAFQFVFEKVDTAYYLKSVANGRYAKVIDRDNTAFSAATTADATPIISINKVEGNLWIIYTSNTYNAEKDGAEADKIRLNTLNGGGAIVVDTWDASDDGNQYAITSVGEVEADAVKDVTFDIYVGGELTNTVTKSVFVGKAPSLDTGDYAIYTYDVEIITDKTDKVNATLVKYSVVSDLAELTKNAKEGFTINSGRGYLYAKDDATYGFILSSLPTADVTAETPNQKAFQFVFEKVSENYYLKSVANGRYAKVIDREHTAFSEATTADATPIISINKAEGNLWIIYFDNTYDAVADKIRLNTLNEGNAIVVDTWDDSDNGNTYAITSVGEVDVPEVTVEPGEGEGGNDGDDKPTTNPSGDNTGDNTGGNTGDNTGGNTGGNTGDNTGGNTGGNSGDNTEENPSVNPGEGSTPISSIIANDSEVEGIFTIEGRKVEKLQRGVNIVRTRNADGTISVKKVILK